MDGNVIDFSTPQKYDDLLRVIPDRAQLDSVLQHFRKTRRIRLTPKGYALPGVQPKDTPLIDKPMEGCCKRCGKPAPRKSSIFCGVECFAASRVLPRPPCRICGTTVNKTDQIYCSVECRQAGRRRKKGKGGRFVK